MLSITKSGNSTVFQDPQKSFYLIVNKPFTFEISGSSLLVHLPDQAGTKVFSLSDIVLQSGTNLATSSISTIVGELIFLMPAGAVVAGGNGNVIVDAVPINGSSNAVSSDGVADAINDLKGGVSASGDTLSKLYNLITSISTLLTSNDVNFDTLQEVVNAIKTDEGLITSLTTNKVNVSDIVNVLTTTATGKVADARTVKALKDITDGIAANIGILTGLTTTDKTSLVNAINEIKALVGTGGGAVDLTNYYTKAQADTNDATVISTIKGGVPVAGDNLSKLYNLITAINTLLTSNDVNLDTLQEVINTIKSDEGLISSLTTNKVNVSDIVNVLTTTATGKVLDARQGKALNDLITAISSSVGTLSGLTTTVKSSLVAAINELKTLIGTGGTGGSTTYTNPATGSFARSITSRLAEELWVEDFRDADDTDADVWEKAIAAMQSAIRPLYAGPKTYTFNRTIIVSGSYWEVIGNHTVISGNIPGFGKINTTTAPDLTYPTTTDPAVLRGSAFYFISLIYYSRFQNITFSNFRFCLSFYSSHNTPIFENVSFMGCNVGVICYQGSQNHYYKDCDQIDTGVMHVSSAVCFPQDHPLANGDNYFSDGLQIDNPIKAFSRALIQPAFDAWFIASIFRPTVPSYTTGSITTYPWDDTHNYSQPTGRVLFIPMRKDRNLFGLTFKILTAIARLQRGFAFVNGNITALTIGPVQAEGVYDGAESPTTPFFTFGGCDNGTIDMTHVNGSLLGGTNPYIVWTNKGHASGDRNIDYVNSPYQDTKLFNKLKQAQITNYGAPWVVAGVDVLKVKEYYEYLGGTGYGMPTPTTLDLYCDDKIDNIELFSKIQAGDLIRLGNNVIKLPVGYSGTNRIRFSFPDGFLPPQPTNTFEDQSAGVYRSRFNHTSDAEVYVKNIKDYPYRRRVVIGSANNGSFTITGILDNNSPVFLPKNLSLLVTDVIVGDGQTALTLTGATFAVSGNNLVVTLAGTDFTTYAGKTAFIFGNHAYETASQSTADTAISAINTRYQPETQAYLARVIAAGGTIDAFTLQHIDKFIWTGKRDGWLPLIDIWTPYGNNLAASLVKLVANATGITSVTNNNFVAADYTQERGFGVAGGNSTKYLSTGFTPSTLFASNNLSFGTFVTDDTGMGNYHFGLTPATGTTTMFVSATEAGYFGAYYQQLRSGLGMKSASFTTSEQNVVFEGTSVRTSTSNIGTGIAINTELNIFRTGFLGALSFSGGKLGFAFWGAGLTNVQLRSLNVAVINLQIATRKYAPQLGVRLASFGDSIVSGGGITASSRMANIIARELGWSELNCGAATSELRQTTNAATGGFQRYTELLALPIGMVLSIYGTNDQRIGDVAVNGNSTLVSDFVTKYNTMVAAWKAAGLKVVIVSCPYTTDSNDTKQQLWVAGCASVAKTNTVPFLDAYNLMKDTGSTATYLADTVHPNAAGNLLIAQGVLQCMKGQLLRNPTLDFPSIAAGTSSDLTVTVYNAVAGMQVELGLPSTFPAGLVATAFVSANDTVIVRLTNITASAIDPVSAQYKVTVYTNY